MTPTTTTTNHQTGAADILNALRSAGLDMTKYKVDARFIKKTPAQREQSDDLADQYDNWELIINGGNPMFLGFNAAVIVEELRDDPEIIIGSIPMFDGIDDELDGEVQAQ